MSIIKVTRHHALSDEQTRASLNQLVEHFSERFGVEYIWEGDRLHFKRAGIDGDIVVRPQAIDLTIHVSILLGFMRHRIEQEAFQHLDRIFGSEGIDDDDAEDVD